MTDEVTLVALLRDHPNRKLALSVLEARDESLVIAAKLQAYGDRDDLRPEDAEEIAELARLGELAARRMQRGLLELHEKERRKASRKWLDVLRRKRIFFTG